MSKLSDVTTVKLSVDTTYFARKCEAVSRHLKALADELEAIAREEASSTTPCDSYPCDGPDELDDIRGE